MSRFFPDYIFEYLKKVSDNSIQLIKAPNLSLGIERDFYKYLVGLVRNDEEYRQYQPLWHAKYSGEYSSFLGSELANTLNFCPDYIVAILGAGSTIEGQAIPIRMKYNYHPRIVVPEHSRSPLLHMDEPATNILRKLMEGKEYPLDWFGDPPEEIPHLVLGPHYDEINPLLKKEVLKSIDSVYRYDDDDWKQMSYTCYIRGLKIGNSSAANLVVAKHLADAGNQVLTFIYEPFRSIYHSQRVPEMDYRDAQNIQVSIPTHQ